MRERSVSISLRIPREQCSRIDNLVDGKKYPDFSHAARDLIEAGFWLFEHKKDLSDPKKSQKLIEEYNSKLNENYLFEWVKQLPDSQIQGIEIAFELEKEKRIKKI